MVWEGSVLDANEGIRFHGRTIKDCQKELPKGKTGTEMLPEAMFWLLLTGQVPSTSQVRVFSRELAEKSELPEFVNKMLDNFPKDLHPMTQFAIAVSALSHTSKFAKAYEQGINKADYWEPTFDDSISLLAKLPVIAAKIYQNSYRGGGALPAQVDLEQDWSYIRFLRKKSFRSPPASLGAVTLQSLIPRIDYLRPYACFRSPR